MYNQLIDLFTKLKYENINALIFEVKNKKLYYVIELNTHYCKEENEYYYDPHSDYKKLSKILIEFGLQPKMFQCEINDEKQILFGELISL